ncbi:MAG: discoidin domain-containing protein [Nitrospiraceae bacterium]|nr:discoidin domain-containing protein [Nitrospiraceae bacterium]
MPDLAINASSISFIPQTITTLPATLAVNVDISNLGTSPVSQATVALYDGDVSDANKIGEQVAAFPGSANTTVTFPAAITDGRERVFTVAVDHLNLIKESDKTNNVAVKSIKPVVQAPSDLSIIDSDITFAPATIGTIPMAVTVKARISNFGTTPVQTFTVALYDGVISAQNKIGDTTASVPGDSYTEISFTTTVSDANDHKYIVVIDPDNKVQESVKTNNTARNVLKNNLVYDFEILPGYITVSPNPADLGQNVTISSKISNKGRQNAYNVHVRYYLDLPGAPFDIATETVDLPAGGSINKDVIWKTSKAGDTIPVTVYVDPLNEFTEVTKTNNGASTVLTVNGPTDPNLTVSYKDISTTPTQLVEGGKATISAVVKNSGYSAASNIAVNLYIGNPATDGVLLVTRTISSLNPGDSTTLTADWNNISPGSKIIYVRVDPNSLIKETTKNDNDAFITINVLSLPDLAVSVSSLQFNPAAPKDGDIVTISVTVKNLGDQLASNINVKISDEAALIGTQNIPAMAGGGQASVSVPYDTKGKSGAHQITVQVDPDNLITERSKDNNIASRTFGVQDARLWVTEPYISPNGDGIKDSTQFFFGLDTAQPVKIAIINERGETVRTFSGPDFENTTGGNITWDGLDDSGMVAADGRYQMKVQDVPGGSTPGSLLVTVDNNRSSIVKALGTKYLLQRNLTCLMPAYDSWQWLPEDKGILFSIMMAEQSDYTPAYTGPYSAGIYASYPDGTESKITSWLQNTYGGSNGNWWYEERFIGQFSVSPDGGRVIYVLDVWDAYTNKGRRELWLTDIDGRNSRMIASYETADWDYKDFINVVGWTPDSTGVFYEHRKPSIYLSLPELLVADIDGGNNTVIENSLNTTPVVSPDSAQIAYAVYDPNASQYLLRISDKSGNKRDLYTSDQPFQINWLRNNAIVLFNSGGIWMVSTSGTKNELKLTDDSRFVSVSSDQNHVVFFHMTGQDCQYRFVEGTWAWVCNDFGDYMVADTSGNTFSVSDTGNKDCTHSPYGSPNWSPDGREIAFFNSCIHNGDAGISVFNLAGKELRYLTLPSDRYISDWFGNTHFMMYGAQGNSLVDAFTAEQTMLTVDIQGQSPAGDVFYFYKAINQGEACFTGRYTFCPGGWWTCQYHQKYQDLWTMKSLLNLTAQLSVKKDRSGITLSGIATDLNFEGYLLEYADLQNPDVWNILKPASDTQVISDQFTTWVPPYEGSFYVRLKVWDRAGNVAFDRKRVSWGASAGIANLYTSADIFSPNGDGVKDTVSLNFSVLEPVHVEFYFYDSDNRLVRTIYKDYISAGADGITWDGKDDSGNIVHDGKYTIKVFNYKFFVETDTTPPDAHISISPAIEIFSAVNLVYEQERHPYAQDISALAYDKNIKKWYIEVGWGDNPVTWAKYAEGTDTLAAFDIQGNPVLKDIAIRKLFLTVLKPLDSIWSIGSYKITNDIGYYAGDRFRITVEDSAGNKSSFVSDFQSEKAFLYEWDNQYTTQNSIPANLARPGRHYLGGLHTMRGTITSAVLQYSQNYNAGLGQWTDWIDAEEIPSASSAFFEWDNSGLNPGKSFGVRQKYVDSHGREVYSNVIHPADMFAAEILCDREYPGSVDMQVTNLVFALQKALKFQVRSYSDARFNSWTDIDVFSKETVFNLQTHSFEEGSIPQGVFTVQIPTDIFLLGTTYELRMAGIVDDRMTQLSVPTIYPPDNCGIKVALRTDYKEAACGMISGQATLVATANYDPYYISPVSLNMYFDKPDGLQLIPSSSQSMDTTAMPEGGYPVKAIFQYKNSEGAQVFQASASSSLIVDRVLPAAGITHPGKSSSLCPVKKTDSEGDWLSIPVEAFARDNNTLSSYRLYYGRGENPEAWESAMTRVSGKEKQIEGKGALQGKMGFWNVTGFTDSVYSLMIKAVDAAGNAYCDMTSFSLDKSVNIALLTEDKRVFSPNGDGTADDVSIDYRIDEYASVDIKVFRSSGADVLDPEPIRTISLGTEHLAGMGSAIWDGMDDSGNTVADGKYGIKVFATDSCLNTTARFIAVEVDNTPPEVAITYPTSPDNLTNVVEIKGIADDLHFSSYVLEAAPAGGDAWQPIPGSNSPVETDTLGTWNTFGLTGGWTIRLTATDSAGNSSSVSATVNLANRITLIKDVSALPQLISPNNDGKLESASIRYELTANSQTDIRILAADDSVARTFSRAVRSAGVYALTWDGKNSSGLVVPDGTYKAQVDAALASNAAIAQSERISLTVDTTPPVIDIRQPADNAYIKNNKTIVYGSITDPNMVSYSISYSGDAAAQLLDSGSQNRTDYTFGSLDDLAEGRYTLTVIARDLGENPAQKTVAFTIDRTPPKVILSAPAEGEIFGNDKSIITISGSIVEKNPESYQLRFGSGTAPAVWTSVASGNAVPASPALASLMAGKNDGVADGIYTLSLLALDKAAQTGEATAHIIIDNTPPEVAITVPKDGDYLKAAAAIKGTALDANLQKYTLEVSEGLCSGAFRWAPVMTATSSVRDGTLGSLQALPPDGNYCLGLAATDKVGNNAQVMVNMKIDTAPPAAPALSGAIENKKNCRLTWSANTEADLAGYDLYRDGQKINVALVHDTQYLDQNLQEKVYTYTITASDAAGNESKPSSGVKLRIDFTGPDARIMTPLDGSRIGSIVDIRGTAYSADDFREYRVYIGAGASPSSWVLIGKSPVPTSYGPLAQWDTAGLPDEIVYSVRLEAEDLSGNISTHQVRAVIDNMPPVSPVLLTAVPTGSDLNLSWKTNTDADLSGYLLYRNDQLANVQGFVSGSLKPYLLSATSYTDKTLSDGRYKYYLLAMDQAGNLSNQSNVIEVNIDTHPPHTIIVEPQDKTKFDKKLMVKAESPDNDISSVQFLYKKAQDATWINLGSPVTKSPYTAYLDPSALGLSYGDYTISSVSTDMAGNVDLTPASIMVTYIDVTPPAPVQNLQASANGSDVTLTWTANSDADLGGYAVYRTAGGSRTKLNVTEIKEGSYHDNGVADGIYTYEVMATDTAGNESRPSNQARARVYSPVIDQPFTPSDKSGIQMRGGNADPASIVEIFNDTGSGAISLGTAQAGADGRFSFNLTLAAAKNRLTAKASDQNGNVSRVSDTVVVFLSAYPSAPTGLAATVRNFDAALTWNANAETDIAGYNLFRNGEKVNADTPITAATLNASSTYSNSAASYALDGNVSSAWLSDYGYGSFNPVWLEVDLDSSEFIDQVNIQWLNDMNSGKDYEIQAWSGYAWIPIQKVTGNTGHNSRFDVKPAYQTNKLRIYITGTNDPYDSKQVGISEISPVKGNPITRTAYNDPALHDGKYSYTATAVNNSGFESLPSAGAKAEVGDSTPPAAPANLSAAVAASNVSLSWTANAEPDLAGYNIYRNTPQGWMKLNSSLIQATAYADSGLPSGNYIYRVTALDVAGNESQSSNEAAAVVYIPDTGEASRPAIFFPTTPGVPYSVQIGRTDISGFAEPGAIVDLYINGADTSQRRATENNTIAQYALDNGACNVSISPDSKHILYTSNHSIWLKSLSAGDANMLVPDADGSLWSPAGDKFAYYYYDTNGNSHIGIHMVGSGSASTLLHDVNSYEYGPSWSSDGNQIAFVSNRGGSDDIWIKDLTSGMLNQVTNGGGAANPQISPDGQLIGYFVNTDLYTADFNSGSHTLVDGQSDGYYLAWSPDSSRLLYKVYSTDGIPDLYVFDLAAQTKSQITDSTTEVDYPVWSPAGNAIAYWRWDGGSYSLLQKTVGRSGTPEVMQSGLQDCGYFVWLRAGAMAYVMGSDLYIVDPRGLFRFAGTVLSAGDNVFEATSTGSSGKTGPRSDAIVVTFDAASAADLETTAEDIYPYPEAPVGGQLLAINIAVWNRGLTTVQDAEADIYISDVTGNVALIKSVVIPKIDPGTAEIIGAVWDTTAMIGTNRIIVVLDPQDKLSEVTKANNYAEKDFPVAAKEGVAMTTSLQKDLIKAAEDLIIRVNIVNSGKTLGGSLDVLIEDESGYPVIVLKSGNADLPYGYLGNTDLSWNAGATYAGTYKVHSVLKDTSGVLAENIMPFSIAPDISVKALLSTDQADYGPNQSVVLSSTLQNSGANYIVPSMKATVRIADASNTERFRSEKTITNTFPGAKVAFDSTWNIGLNTPGAYTAFMDISVDGNQIAVSSATFKVKGTPVFSGTIAATPSVVVYGGQLSLNYSVSNAGNADATGVALRLIVLDPETRAVMKQIDEPVDIAGGGTISRQTSLSTQGYGLKTYTILLQDITQNSPKGIAGSSFAVVDGVQPVVTVISPEAGRHYNGRIDLAVTATDDSSGVDRVYYQVDERGWISMPVPDTLPGRYSAVWTPEETDEGPHTVFFNASDRAGNLSVPVSTRLTVDLTSPVIQLSTLSDGSWTNNELLNISGRTTDNVGITRLAVNGTETPVAPDSTFSHAIILQDGPNEITVTAADPAGNKTVVTRTINLDRTLPAVTILTPADNMKSRLTSLELTGFVDEEALVTVTVNGSSPVPAVAEGNTFSLQIAPSYGINTIEVAATDRAGNTAVAKRTFVFDDRTPSLSVITPDQDIKTNKAAMVIKGVVEDLTSVAVTIELEGTGYAPAVTAGTFEQAVTFDRDGLYRLSVRATDETGNETTVIRNIIYDNTPPTVTIGTVTSPTNQTVQAVSGDREPNTTVAVTCPSATVGTVTYPTETTWSAELRDMHEGVNIITATATDEAGNISLPDNAGILVDLTSPAVIIVSPPNGSSVGTEIIDIKGSTEPGASVRMVSGSDLTAAADPATGAFAFEQVRLTPGQNSFVFSATDRAGNTGPQTAYTLTLGANKMILRGSITVRPDAVPRGRETLMAHTVTNGGTSDVSSLQVRVEVSEKDSGRLAATFENTVCLPAMTTMSGTFTLKTDRLAPGQYIAVLLVRTCRTCRSLELVRTSFSVTPGIGISKSVADARNLLVWLNQECGATQGEFRPAEADDPQLVRHGDARRCIREDLLTRAFNKISDHWFVVRDPEDFQSELRNPFYSDIFILGADRFPEPGYLGELREKVYSGTGLISSLWLGEAEKEGELRDALAGVRYRSQLPAGTYDIHIPKGTVSSGSEMTVTGIAQLIKVMPGATSAGWFTRASSAQRSDALVLNAYGRGRTAYYAFDIGTNIDDDNYEKLADLLAGSLGYVHQPQNSESLMAGGLVPVELKIGSFGNAYDLLVKEAYPQQVRLLEPDSLSWIPADPWEMRVHLDPFEAKTRRFHAWLPDRADTYMLKTDLACLPYSKYCSPMTLSLGLPVERNLKDRAAAILAEVDGIVGQKQYALAAARNYISKVRTRTVASSADIDLNIRDIVSAIGLLPQLFTDTTRIRLMMDDLLRGWQGRYYFWR